MPLAKRALLGPKCPCAFLAEGLIPGPLDIKGSLKELRKKPALVSFLDQDLASFIDFLIDFQLFIFIDFRSGKALISY